MKFLTALIPCVCLLVPCGGRVLKSAADHEGAAMPPEDDPGHNTHQESVIFGCLGIIIVLAVLCTLLLWFIVERTKSEIRRLDKIIPEIAERMRKETITANSELMSGTLTASHEFETEFLTNEDVQLTAYRRQNETESGTGATAPTAEEGNNAVAQADQHKTRPNESGRFETSRNETGRNETDGNEQIDSGRRRQRRERGERHDRHERRSGDRHERHSYHHSYEREDAHSHRHGYERHSYDPRATPYENHQPAIRSDHGRRSRPPPSFFSTYDNPGLCLRDEQDYRRERRNGPTPAPKPAKRSTRPVSAYATSENEYTEEAARPISIIGLGGGEDERRPTRLHGYGHGRRYKSLLYESHV